MQLELHSIYEKMAGFVGKIWKHRQISYEMLLDQFMKGLEAQMSLCNFSLETSNTFTVTVLD